jgi:Mn-containing catalase
MIMRLDRLIAELPPPSDPDPNGASVVQELLGGKFGEMSTFMNYTYQSFNFRNRQGARPFYDLVASIAAEEFAHIELVSTAINTMLTGAAKGKAGKKGSLKGVKDARNSQQFLAGGAAAMVQDSMGKPWNGDYVNATGDLIGDLTHNYFLETGARNNKLKVYEAVDHPAARALTGYLLVRGGVAPGRLRPGAGEPDRRRHVEVVPLAAHPDGQNPRVQAAHQTRRTSEALPLVSRRLPGARGGLQRTSS